MPTLVPCCGAVLGTRRHHSRRPDHRQHQERPSGNARVAYTHGSADPLKAHAEDNPLPAAAIVAAAVSVEIAACEAESAGAALRDLVRDNEPGRVLICGSLHLAGVVLAENG